MKLCHKCNKNPRVDDKNRSRRMFCKQCWTDRSTEWNKKNRDRVRNNELQRKFGINFEEYNRMLTAQGGVCGICKEVCISKRGLAVDHNHTTLKNRGLLCVRCNLGIGQLRDSPAILQLAINYLNSYAS